MRSALVVAVFAIATARGGCGTTDPSPPYDPCAASRCGDPCRACPPDDAGCFETAVVKGCDAAGQCVTAPVECSSSGCEGEPCGAPCTLAPPCDGAVCPAMAMMGACDGAGACVAPDTIACIPPPPDPCAGLACGDDCVIDPPCAPLCLMPSLLGKCDPAGSCQPVTEVKCEPPPPPPYDPCAGKGCGDFCDPCIPGTPCPMYFAASACDPLGQCVTAGTFKCGPAPPPPLDPCAGKLCGDACSTCGPATDTVCAAVMMYCDAAGACSFAYPACN
jgi:hypothetical protein